MSEFLNEYKQLEKLCNDIYNQNSGISAYIEDMKNTPQRYSKCIPGWDADFYRLNQVRHIRNAMVHDTSVDVNDYSPEMLKFVVSFHQRILNCQDPLALCRKLQADKKLISKNSKIESEKTQHKTSDAGRHDYKSLEKVFVGLLIVSVILFAIIAAVLLTGCRSSAPGTASVIRTYEVTDPELSEEYFAEDKLVTMVRYYELSDGTWKTDDHIYQYRLEITGRLGGAAKDSTFVYLSNLPEITFDQAWKAAGLSSNMNDYFDPADAVLVEMK